MKYINLGKSGLKVSRIGLGCMSYGDPTKGTLPWVLREEQSRPFIRHAIEQGINYFDTANLYSEGISEEILGRAIRDFARREEVVVATKVYFPMRKDPNSKGLSRKTIMTEIDASLKRLNMDYVDLYQIHRWDDDTPIEETMETLHDLVKAGKVRYIGASSMHAWQFCKALYVAEKNGWTRIISMQNHYNLLYREEEREMLGLCKDQDVGVVPWSPLARGLLTRPWIEHDASTRFQSDPFSKKYYGATEDADCRIVKRVAEISNQHGVPQAQIALAWLLRNPVVTAPIIGATKLKHIDDAVAALAVKLSDDDARMLEELYVSHPIAGFDHPHAQSGHIFHRTADKLKSILDDLNLDRMTAGTKASKTEKLTRRAKEA